MTDREKHKLHIRVAAAVPNDHPLREHRNEVDLHSEIREKEDVPSERAEIVAWDGAKELALTVTVKNSTETSALPAKELAGETNSLDRTSITEKMDGETVEDNSDREKEVDTDVVSDPVDSPQTATKQ